MVVVPLDKCACYAVCIDPERKAVFERIFPGGRVPIKSPVPVCKDRFADGGIYYYYSVDMNRVSAELRLKAVEEIVAKFKLSPDGVSHEVDVKGIPLRADDLIVTWCPSHIRAAM